MKQQLGHYDIVSELGRDGMGIVYKGYEASLNRYVAIKVLAESLAHDASVKERFLREARSMASLNDPHIIQIYFIGDNFGQPYFVMEFVDGESLGSVLKREVKLKPEQAAKVIYQTALGLSTAHDKGVIHRDIKPGNLMLTARGSVKIADFGIALTTQDFSKKLTSTGEFVGTPGYLSPEVCLGKPVDQRSDIFSLGIVMFESLTGRMPFTDESPLGMMVEIVKAEIPDVRSLNVEVDPELSRVLQRMIAKNPAERYQSYHELVADLGQHPLVAKGGPIALQTMVSPAAATETSSWRPMSSQSQPQSAASMPRSAPGTGRTTLESVLDRFGSSRHSRIEKNTEATSIHPPIDNDDIFFPVWFATNRNLLKPRDDDPNPSFGSQRSETLTRGRAEVFIPKSHRMGEISGCWWDKLRHANPNYGRVKLKKTRILDTEPFWSEILKVNLEERNPQSLVFIHGYNNTFEDAAIRAAQLARDLRVTGATAFFSWPSRGNPLLYMADEATIEASEKLITEFLIEFATKCGTDTVHVIAHSMGNRGLLRAMQRIASDATAASKVKFAQIFLAAPDIDRDMFLDLAHLYRGQSKRTTLYASSGDLAVYFSKCIHWNHRAGYFKPYTVISGVDTIAVPKLNFKLLGHGYFADSAKLLHDIYDLMRNGTPPDRRQSLSRRTYSEKVFWELTK